MGVLLGVRGGLGRRDAGGDSGGEAGAEVVNSGLHEYLDGLQMKMNGIGDSLLTDFFAWRPLDQTMSQAAGL